MGRNVEENKTREIKAMSKPVNDNIAIIVFKALADESRLKIISILLQKDSYCEYLAEKLGLSAPTITYHMDKLEKAGIVIGTKIQHYVIYSLNREIMDKEIGQLIKSAISFEDENTYEKKVIESFFKYGKLKQIPTQLKKREIVIGHIAERFEFQREYSELEVIAILLEIHDDYCTIKRDLIGFGYLEDLNLKYKRIK